MVCLEDHELFGAIGVYYADFSQIADDEVIELLNDSGWQKASVQSGPRREAYYSGGLGAPQESVKSPCRFVATAISTYMPVQYLI